jgi:hypothetical protein
MPVQAVLRDVRDAFLGLCIDAGRRVLAGVDAASRSRRPVRRQGCTRCNCRAARGGSTASHVVFERGAHGPNFLGRPQGYRQEPSGARMGLRRAGSAGQPGGAASSGRTDKGGRARRLGRARAILTRTRPRACSTNARANPRAEERNSCARIARIARPRLHVCNRKNPHCFASIRAFADCCPARQLALAPRVAANHRNDCLRAVTPATTHGADGNKDTLPARERCLD